MNDWTPVEDLSPELYFLKYAYPCLEGRVRKGLAPEDAIPRLKQAIETDIPVERDYLERCFSEAIENMREFTDDIWNVDNIREYFWRLHGEQLRQKEYIPDYIKTFCAVQDGELESEMQALDNGFKVYKVKLESGELKPAIILYKNPSCGDHVKIHQAYAVEKVV